MQAYWILYQEDYILCLSIKKKVIELGLYYQYCSTKAGKNVDCLLSSQDQVG